MIWFYYLVFLAACLWAVVMILANILDRQAERDEERRKFWRKM